MVRRQVEQQRAQLPGSPGAPIDAATWSEVVAALQFSPQQARIVELILCGACDKQIAQCLSLSVDTVRTYLKRIDVRLGVSGRVELVVRVFTTALEIVERKRCHQ